jgi:hypothetical protein
MKNKKYQCDECGKAFENQNSVNAHKSIHAQDVGECQYCGEEKFRVKLHKLKCTKNPIHYKECIQCGNPIVKKYLSLLKEVVYCSRRCGEIGRSMTYEECKDAVLKLTYLQELQGTSLIDIMKKNGWGDELTAHLIRQLHTPYTEEEVLREAKKYETRNDFRVDSPGPYNAANRLGIMDKAVQHMGKSLIEKQFTKEEILESAKKYNNQQDWLKNEPEVFRCWQGYNKPNQSKKNVEFWKEIRDQLGYVFKPNGYWTKERCKEVSDKYTDRKLFHKEQKIVYMVIVRDGWADELLSHMIWTTKRGNVKYPSDHVWILKDAKKEAKKYKFRGEVQTNNNHLYQWIKTHKWEGKCYPHMKEYNLSKRHIYVEEFKNSKTAYIGLSCQVERRHNAHLGKESKYGKVKSMVYHYMKKTREEPKLKILTRRPVNSENAGERENYYMEKYKENGWKLLNQATAGSLGSMRPKWTYKKFEEIKNDCKTQEEFFQKLEGFQRYIAKKNGWWEKLISDLPIKSKLGRIPNTRWTVEEALEVTRECKNPQELQKKYSGAYKTILRNGGRKALRKVYPDMQILYRDLDEETVLTISKKFRTISDLRGAHKAVWQFIVDNNLLDKTFPNRRKEQIPSAYWNEKTVTEESKKCKKVSDLPVGAYKFVSKNKLQKKLFPKTYFGTGWGHLNFNKRK